MKRIIKIFLIIVLSFTIVNAKEVDFSINDIEVVDSSTSALVGTPSFVSNKIDADTLLNEKEDYVIYNVNIKNNDSENYKLIKIEDNNTNSTINISYDSDTKTINSKDNINLTVKVTYSKLVKNIDKKTLKDFDVILVLQDTKGDIYERIINPDTGDNIILYIVIFIVSIVGMTLILKEKKKMGLSLFILLMAITPMMILGKEEYRVPIRFSNISLLGEMDTYNIIIDHGDGTAETRVVRYGDKVGTLTPVSKDGYNFIGWVDNNGNSVDENTVITDEITIIPKFNIINYNITYNLDGGSCTNVSSYTIEDEITLNNPTKVGYTFNGWSEGDSAEINTNVTISRGSMGDKRFTAHYSANVVPYVVIHKKMKLNGEYVEVERDELSGPTDSLVTPNTKDYYGFKKPSTQTVSINGNGSTEIIYLYERDKFDLVVNNSQYVSPSDASGEYYYESVVSLTAIDKIGYKFTKWSNDVVTKVINLTITEDTTIGPIYSPIQYSIVFNSNGGTGNMDSMDVSYDESVQLTPNAFNRTDYVFVEWNTKPDGSGTKYSNKASVKNLTSEDGATVNLYAIWKVDPEHFFDEEESFNGNNYLNTGIEVFNSDNYKRNFEISVDIKDIDSSVFDPNNEISGTVFNTLRESNPWPGIVFRINGDKWELKANVNKYNNTATVTFEKDEVQSIKVIRINSIVYYSINGDNPVELLDMSAFNNPFNGVPVTFGASVQSNDVLYEPETRNLTSATLANMEVKFLPDDADISDYGNVKSFDVVYKHDGDYTFAGDCSDLIEPTLKNGDLINLYEDETMLNKDFEISFKIDNYDFNEQPSQATLINTKPEDGGLNPGFALRFASNQNRLQLVSRGNTSGDNKIINLPLNPTSVKISRIDGKLYYSVNDGSDVLAHDLTSFNKYYDTPLVVGGLKNSSGNYSRCFKGTISDIVIKVEK